MVLEHRERKRATVGRMMRKGTKTERKKTRTKRKEGGRKKGGKRIRSGV